MIELKKPTIVIIAVNQIFMLMGMKITAEVIMKIGENLKKIGF